MYETMLDTIGLVAKTDPELAAAMNRELVRQRQNIELIASENIVSPAVMAAMGSVLTNKYAEGYPGKRYYGGCMFVDEVEQLAIDRACRLFGSRYANVQPHSGAQANIAVYFALLEPGDTVMGMSLAQGGHLTHGCPVNLSGSYYHFVSYGVDPGNGSLIMTALWRQAEEVQAKDDCGRCLAPIPGSLILSGFRRDLPRRVRRLFDGGHGPYCWLGGRGLHQPPGTLCGCGHHHHA